MKTASIIKQDNTFVIENQWIRRVIRIDEHGVITSSFSYLGQELLKKNHHEFQISVDRHLITGYREELHRIVDGQMEHHDADIRFIGETITVPDDNYKRLDLRFDYRGHTITLRYEVAEKLPAMRKRLLFTAGKDEACLENVIFDDTPLAFGDISDCDCYIGMDAAPAPNSFTRSGDTDFLRFYNPVQKRGFYLGNTAPGPLRYFLIYPEWYNFIVGYNGSSAPFCKFVASGETFASAESLTCFYEGEATDGIDDWRALVRSRLPRLERSDTAMYCTWVQMYKNINEKNIRELANIASEIGLNALVIDDGWFKANSDWEVDETKFPNGLEPLSDYIHGKGLAFGLWFNIGTDYGMKTDKEKFATRLADGAIKKLGWDYEKAGVSQCFASGHCERMCDKLDELARRYKVDYFKMDFSSILSPYGILPFGCHAKDHSGHRGFADSINAMYDGFMKMRDELKALHPHLLLDFSFECFGLEEPTLAALEYSDLNHLSNMTCLNPETQKIVRIRRDFYRQAASLPPERLMHGLPVLTGDSAVEFFLTSLCGTPLVSGDLRTIGATARKRLPKLCAAYKALSAKSPLTGFQVLFSNATADAFRRYADDGRELWCVFNRADTELRLDDGGKGLVNAESGEHGVFVPPYDCAMFLRR